MRYVDLFCGIGGFRVGLDRLGHTCVYSSDIDPHARNAYHANFGDMPAGDIKKIRAEEIPNHDILCAGFPCQPFSASGNRKGMSDPRGGLIYEVIRIAKFHQPKIILLENVPGILTIENGNVIKEICRALKKIGYLVQYDTLNAAHFGIPQNRKRVYFVCIHTKAQLFYTPPQPQFKKNRFKNVLLSAEDALKIDPNCQIRNRDDITPPHSAAHIVGMIGAGGGGRTVYTDDSVACTQLASISADACSGLYFQQIKSFEKWTQEMRAYTNAGRPVAQKSDGNGVIRRLVIPEIKRVMGFSDDHIVSDGRRGQRQLGNAVIPQMVEIVMNGIII